MEGRVGRDAALALTGDMRPISASQAHAIGMVDNLLLYSPSSTFGKEVRDQPHIVVTAETPFQHNCCTWCRRWGVGIKDYKGAWLSFQKHIKPLLERNGSVRCRTTQNIHDATSEAPKSVKCSVLAYRNTAGRVVPQIELVIWIMLYSCIVIHHSTFAGLSLIR